MLVSILAAALATSTPADPQTTAHGSGHSTGAGHTAAADRFEGRPEARIAFENDIRGFRVEREGRDDILYLEGPSRRWYRAEINCFGGASDARFAFQMLPVSRGGGFDRFSRVRFFDGIGLHPRHGTECLLQSLIELTPEEAVEFRLRRAPRDQQAAAPTTR